MEHIKQTMSHNEDIGSHSETDDAIRECQEKDRTIAPPGGLPTEEENEEEPELHARTWIAVAAMFMVSFTGVLALNGPPTVVCLRQKMAIFPGG